METETSKREVAAGTLTLRVSEGGSICVLALSGELDLANAETLSNELRRLEAAGTPLEIDLSELEFIDSSGLAILVAAHHRLERRLRLLPSTATEVRRVLSVTGLDTRLPFSPPAER